MTEQTTAVPVVQGCLDHQRAEYAMRFPAWTQHLITVFSGKASSGQRPPRFVPPPVVNWLLTLVQLIIAVAGTVAAVRYTGWLGVVALPLTWLLTVNALRKLQVTYSHHAVHKEVSGNDFVDRMVQVVSSAVSLTSNYEDIFEDHVRNHHNRKVFTTVHDPDVAFLIYLGFRPGTPVRKLRWRLLYTPLLPRFHFAYIIGRFKTNFITATWSRRMASVVWVGTLVGLAFVLSPAEYVLAVIVPWFPLYHTSGLLQTITEHQWMASDSPVTSREDYASRCWARFCLEPLPPVGLRFDRKLLAWARWSLGVLFVQVPARFGVLVSDLPPHDLHHLVPADHRWELAYWHRQMRIEEGHPSKMQERELSLGQALDIALRTISASPARTNAS